MRWHVANAIAEAVDGRYYGFTVLATCTSYLRHVCSATSIWTPIFHEASLHVRWTRVCRPGARVEYFMLSGYMYFFRPYTRVTVMILWRVGVHRPVACT